MNKDTTYKLPNAAFFQTLALKLGFPRISEKIGSSFELRDAFLTDVASNNLEGFCHIIKAILWRCSVNDKLGAMKVFRFSTGIMLLKTKTEIDNLFDALNEMKLGHIGKSDMIDVVSNMIQANDMLRRFPHQDQIEVILNAIEEVIEEIEFNNNPYQLLNYISEQLDMTEEEKISYRKTKKQ